MPKDNLYTMAKVIEGICRICKTSQALYFESRRCRPCNNTFMRAYNAKNREKTLAIHRASRVRRYAADPRQRIRDKANAAVHVAIKKGNLEKQPCEECGKVAQAHHDSYKRAWWLFVRWLCQSHHKEWHRFNQAIY